jgi:hypothetical protein
LASIHFHPRGIWGVMLELRTGWNMGSLPVCPDDMSAASDLGDIWDLSAGDLECFRGLLCD